MSRQDVRDPRGARRARRHLGPVPLSRASARTPTCTRSATRSSRGRTPKSIADGPSILDYVRDTAARARRRAARSASATASCAPSGRPTEARWTVEAERTRHRRDASSSPAASCSCAAATTATTRATRPSSRAPSASAAQIVHPQHWPEDLDYAGKRVVVIGSGATAVTLVPAMAESAGARDDAAALADATSSSLPAEDPIAKLVRARAARASSPTRSCAGRTCC